MQPVALSSYTLVTALGRGVAAHREALLAGRSGLEPCTLPFADLATQIGRVAGIEDEPLPQALAAFDCRNNRLARAGLHSDGFAEHIAAARARYGAGRIGVFVGSSTSGIDRTEAAYRAMGIDGRRLPDWFDYRRTHNAFSPADFVRHALALEGVTLVIATACSSSAKAFATAARYMAAGLCDAAVVGGVDSLCLTTLYGFNALELVSNEPCRPWDRERKGISLAEAAGFALIEPAAAADDAIALLGYGESSDAYHMSSPHPEGAGAIVAMQAALARAGLAPAAVDYVNLHGTGTPANDLAEDRAVMQVFGAATPCSSTKGATGHALGAAGVVEALICALAVEEGLIPGMPHTRALDPALHARVEIAHQRRPVARTLTNSFGFGGSNCSLVLGRRADG